MRFRGWAKGLEMLKEAKEKYGMPTVTEVMSPNDVAVVCEYADVLQIGVLILRRILRC